MSPCYEAVRESDRLQRIFSHYDLPSPSIPTHAIPVWVARRVCSGSASNSWINVKSGSPSEYVSFVAPLLIAPDRWLVAQLPTANVRVRFVFFDRLGPHFPMDRLVRSKVVKQFGHR